MCSSDLSSSNWIRASSSVSCFPPPVIHDPQASACACAGIVARSQSSRISAAAPRTTLDVTADAGASGFPLLLAARPLQSSCKTRSLSRCHRAVDFGFQTLKSPASACTHLECHGAAANLTHILTTCLYLARYIFADNQIFMLHNHWPSCDCC